MVSHSTLIITGKGKNRQESPEEIRKRENFAKITKEEKRTKERKEAKHNV